MKLNWLAVMVAAIAYWMLGAVWFTLFNKIFVAGAGIPADVLAKMRPTPWPYVIALLCDLVIAVVLAKIIGSTGQWGVLGGLRVGFVLGLGIAFTAMITEMSFELKTEGFMLVTAVYPVLGCMLAGVILGMWKPKGA